MLWCYVVEMSRHKVLAWFIADLIFHSSKFIGWSCSIIQFYPINSILRKNVCMLSNIEPDNNIVSILAPFKIDMLVGLFVYFVLFHL